MANAIGGEINPLAARINPRKKMFLVTFKAWLAHPIPSKQ